MYSTYDQISTTKGHKLKTAFITKHTNYDFEVMLFGLKNEGVINHKCEKGTMTDW